MGSEEGGRAPSNDDEGAPDADPSTVTDPAFRRRMFLRRIAAEAIVAGGRLAGTAQILQRSATAAGETLLGELGARPAAPLGAPGAEAPRAADPGEPAPGTDGPAVRDPQASEPWKPWSPPLTGDREALLARAVPAAFATLQPGDGPHLTAGPFHWDGGAFRLSALDWTARTLNVQADPRVSLLIADPQSELWVSVNGKATVIVGPAAETETLPILRKYAADEADAAAWWAELNADGDRAVIVVVPERMLWRADEPAWRSIGRPGDPGS